MVGTLRTSCALLHVVPPTKLEKQVVEQAQSGGPKPLCSAARRSELELQLPCHLQTHGICTVTMGTLGTTTLQKNKKQLYFLETECIEGSQMFLAMAFFRHDS